MTDKTGQQNIAGVVLVGGRSSRMGRDKAQLEYGGRPLYQHMSGILLAAGVSDIFLSGHVAGALNCLEEPAPHEGPARALAYVMQQLQERFSHILVVPVDMPLLQPALLLQLVSQGQACSYEGHPLPAFLQCLPVAPDVRSIYGLLSAQNAGALPLPAQAAQFMQNINTPEEWAQLQRETLVMGAHKPVNPQ